MELHKSDIQKLIKVHKKSTLWNHIFHNERNKYKIHGEIQYNKIKVWQSVRMTGSFYPVYTFEFNSEDELIKITDKLNPFGKFLALLFPIFYFYSILSTAFSNFEIKRFFAGIAVFSFLTSICFLVFNKVYQYEKKEQLNDFYKELGIKIEGKPEKEWSINKTIKRLFMYLLCFGFILLCIFLLIPNGGILIAIPLLGIIGIYLYSDFKMISKDKQI